jgi:carbon-monoxide dehydrogenase medium subunit
VKPAPFDYHVPQSVTEAVALLAEAGGGATVLAGGQTLMPLLALRMSQPFVLVDINRIAALTETHLVDDCCRIGAMTRQADALTDSMIAGAQPVLVAALRHVGHHQTRNRGTIGGSIALGEPAAEMPATAVALGARLHLVSQRGERVVSAEEFYLGPYMTAIEPDELLTAIDYPMWPAGTVTIFREVARRPGDFALVGLVGAIHIAAGRIERAGLAWFGMGPIPIKARDAERQLIGSRVEEVDPHAIAELAIAETDPFEDHHATAFYRRTVGRRIFAQALHAAVTGESIA